MLRAVRLHVEDESASFVHQLLSIGCEPGQLRCLVVRLNSEKLLAGLIDQPLSLLSCWMIVRRETAGNGG